MIWLSDKNASKIVPLRKTYEFAGKKITFETWKFALLASWAVTISDENENILFVTTWFKVEWVNKDADFFPLVVDYQEKFYATGKIGGNRFQRREGRPSDAAMLIARMIDRPIRPMFPKWIVNDTQIIASVLSSNGETDLWFFWIIGASLGLLMAWTPFEWPVWATKIVLTNDWKYIFNPTVLEENEAKLSLITAWTLDAITMVESGWKEVTDEEMVKALEYSHNIIKEICKAQVDYIEDFKKMFGIPEIEGTYNTPDTTLYKEVEAFLDDKKMDVLYGTGKKEFQKELDKLDIITREYLSSKWFIAWEWEKTEKQIEEKYVWEFVYKRVKEVMRKNILEKSKRLDLRELDEVRTIVCETGLLPRTHGSALFQRGMTQSLSITTLGWPDDEITIDWMMPESSKRFMHHYNFPPYSVWEVRMLRWVGRREIGHWALAERAIEPVLPSEADFPYVIRAVSEITTCNGSSSMASICGTTLSLMQAWVPIKTPVAWVAMWMIYDEKTWNYKILSDIQAQEDFLWDMDLKIARTKNWITALQLDVKIKWLKMNIFEEAFKQWGKAISHILDKMLEVQPTVATELSKYAPLIMNISIPEDKIRVIIGKWGENVQRMEKEYWVKVSIADDWMTTITAANQEWGLKAIADIKQILWVPEVWYKDTWKVVKIIDGMWAIVEFRGKSGMIHISKLSYKRIENVQDVVKEGDIVNFEIIQVDIEKGRIGLKKELTETEKKEVEEIKAKKETK